MNKPTEPTMTDVLANAAAAADHVAQVAAELATMADVPVEATDPPPPAPFVYDTETTEVARTFYGQIDRLTRLIKEDDDEIAFVEKERDQKMHELQLRFEAEQDDILKNARQGTEIVTARRKDRANARAALQKVVAELKGNKE